MTGRRDNLIKASVEEFLTDSSSNSGNTSLAARVPPGLKLILRRVSRELLKKAPDRLYTAAQIASITKAVYYKKSEVPPEILGNTRAFGRFLQKYPQVVWFDVEGNLGNRRTYKPHQGSSLD